MSNETDDLDSDLNGLSVEALQVIVKGLRRAIRQHRDCQGHDLCWYHPELWGLLPEHRNAGQPDIPHVPSWSEFMQGCVAYRASLDKKVHPSKGGCWYCKKDHGLMEYSQEFDTYLHLSCLRSAASDPHDTEARIIAREILTSSEYAELLEASS